MSLDSYVLSKPLWNLNVFGFLCFEQASLEFMFLNSHVLSKPLCNLNVLAPSVFYDVSEHYLWTLLYILL
jgi:hypothetical protein